MDPDDDPAQLLQRTADRPRRVLVVDDDPVIRRVLTLNFEAEGYEVSEAADGEAAQALAQATHPDVMVLDVMMPGTDGYTVLKALRASPQTDDIPVVLLSARASDEEVFQGWQSGADSYLTKPFEIDDLIRVVAAVTAADGELAGPAADVADAGPSDAARA